MLLFRYTGEKEERKGKKLLWHEASYDTAMRIDGFGELFFVDNWNKRLSIRGKFALKIHRPAWGLLLRGM